MALIIKTSFATLDFDDNENINSIGEYQVSVIEHVEATGIYLDCILALFTPVNPRGCINLTIPVSTQDSQRWYGDTAKTIIYALLQ